jgi:dTDP-4-amino-4,6-dideoxygalactose transaminase
MPPYISATGNENFPVAEYLSANGISLPTWNGLTEKEINYVCDSLIESGKRI